MTCECARSTYRTILAARCCHDRTDSNKRSLRPFLFVLIERDFRLSTPLIERTDSGTGHWARYSDEGTVSSFITAASRC